LAAGEKKEGEEKKKERLNGTEDSSPSRQQQVKLIPVRGVFGRDD